MEAWYKNDESFRVTMVEYILWEVKRTKCIVKRASVSRTPRKHEKKRAKDILLDWPSQNKNNLYCTLIWLYIF
jgi:hypothetical protein